MNPVQTAEQKALFARSVLIVIAAVTFSTGCLVLVTDIPGLMELTVLGTLIVATTFLIERLLKIQVARKMEIAELEAQKEKVSGLHHYLHGSKIYQRLGKEWNRLANIYHVDASIKDAPRVIQYSVANIDPKDSKIQLDMFKGESIIPVVFAIYTSQLGRIGVSVALAHDVIEALIAGQSAVKWEHVSLGAGSEWFPGEDQEWFETTANVSKFELENIVENFDPLPAMLLLQEPGIDHTLKCALIESKRHLIERLDECEPDILERWCNRYLCIGDDQFAWPSGNRLLPAIARKIPEIVRKSSGLLPKALTIPLGRYCLDCADEEPLRQFCFYLAQACGRTQSRENDPLRQNAWLIKAVHHHKVLQGDMLELVRDILARYPAEDLDHHDENYLKGYQYLYGTEQALARFPEASRLFLLRDLGV